MIITTCITIVILFSSLFSQVIEETGSLKGFFSGSCSNCSYDNYINHTSEGIATEGYNIYAPDSIDVQTNGFGDYRIISQESETLLYWRNILNAFLENNIPILEQMLSDSSETFNYNIIEFEDTIYHRTYMMLRENLDMSFYDSNLVNIDDDDIQGSFKNGWGLYIINPNAANKEVVIEVPHPNDDFISPYISMELFLETDAFAFLIAGAGREVKWTNQGNYTNDKSKSDPSRNTNTVFHQFHEILCDSLINLGPHSPLVLHMHSFDENQSHEGFNSIILSGGYDAEYVNKPIRDVSEDHLDIINFTQEVPIPENQFAFLGNHDELNINQYYQAHYDSIFNYYGTNQNYEIPHAYELIGPYNSVQMLYLRNYFNNREVYEPWVQIELDEKPQFFKDMLISDNELYETNFPTTFNNFSIINNYYLPFIDAVKLYLSNWNNTNDIDPPDAINNLSTSFDGFHYVKLNWTPVEDSNFKSYRIYFDQDSITTNSPYWDKDVNIDLLDMRTNEAIIYNLDSNNDYHFSVRSIDYFNNLSDNSNITYNDVESHLENLVIQNFESDSINLFSFPNHDQHPDDWQIDSLNTFYNSNGSLKLFGNTWKVENIDNQQIENNDIWQISSFAEETGEIIGIAFQDSINTLYYSLYGSQELDIEEWVTVYQGSFPENQWNIFQLPIADDWFAYFDYYPLIENIVYINDKDNNNVASISYFDDLVDITNSIPYAPIVNIDYEIENNQRVSGSRNRSISVNFISTIEDDDSNNFTYLWHFGDGESSYEESPSHTYLIEDDHAYNIILQVTDNNNNIGYATEQINLEYGISTLPLTMNFVGDIMLGRNYDNSNGIIAQYGVEYIFEHTLDYLGNQADVTVANLECPLTLDGPPHPTKSVVFKAKPDNVQGLVYAGIDIVSLANNHTLDYGLDGLINTQNILDENNILYSGAGSNSYEAYQPLIYNSHGLNIAFLASSDRTGQYNNYQPYLHSGYNKPGFAYMTPYYLLEQIEAVEDISDFIIVEMHAGSEYSTQPGQDYDSFINDNIETNHYFGPNENIDYMDIIDISDEEENYTPFIDVPHMWDREIRYFAIDNGADLVIIHHPHVIQGFEVYNEKLIAHSLGNFVFDLSYPETFPSVILNASIDTLSIHNFNVDPVYIDDNIPYIAKGGLGLHILDYLAYKSKELDTYLDVDRTKNKAFIILDTTSINETNIISKSTVNTFTDDSYTYSTPIRIHDFGYFKSIDSLSNDFEYRVGRDLLWFGNMEDEGCTLWNINNENEYYDNNNSYTGAQSMCLNRNSESGDNIVTNLQHRIKINDNMSYGLLAALKTENTNSANIEIKYYNSRSSSFSLGTDSFENSLSGNHDWTNLYNNINPRSGTNFFDIRLYLDVPEIDSSKAWFDNVNVIEWTDWKSIGDYDDVLIPNDYYFIQIRNSNSVIPSNIIHTEVSYSNTFIPVNPNFSIIQNDYVNPSTIEFIDESSGSIGWYFWEFGDGATSIEKNPVHSYSDNGPYSVTLTVLDYNGNTLTRSINNLINFYTDLVAGDLNFDNQLDILDLVAMINLILNNLNDYSGILHEISDIDNNGNVDVVDIVLLVNLILN